MSCGVGWGKWLMCFALGMRDLWIGGDGLKGKTGVRVEHRCGMVYSEQKVIRRSQG